MFGLIQDTPTGSDCTAGYKVQLKNQYTVKEFIEEVLKKHPGEWGDIELKNLGARTKYRYGTLVKQNFADQLLDSRIVKAYAVGGYSNMDYILTIELVVSGTDGNATESKDIFQNGNSQSELPFRCTSEQIETLDRLCNNIRRETIDMEKVIARLMNDNRNLRQEVESLNHIVNQINRKEKNV